MASRDIKVTIIGDASSVQKAFSSGEKAAGGFESKLGQVGKVAAGVVSGGALLSMGSALLDGAKGATEDALALDKLKVAVENSGGSWDDYSGQVDDAIKKGQDLAFTDGETTAALQALTEMTGDSGEAMKRLSLAQDLARAKGISLQDASKLLGKVSDENTTALRKMGVAVEDGATAQDVLNAVDKQFTGQAGTFAESDAGKMLKAQQASGELTEQLGTYLIPVIALVSTTMLALTDILATKIVPAIQGAVEAFLSFVQPITSFVADNLGPLLAGLAAIGAAILVTVIPALAAWVLGMIPVIGSHVALAAAVVVAYAPIIAIVLAVGVAVALLYKAWQENLFGIQDTTKAVIDFLLPYLQAAWDGIKAGVDAFLGALLTAWNAVFPVIQSVIETVFPIIAQIATTYIGILKYEIELAINAVKWIFENVFPIVQGIVSDVFNTIAGIISTVWGPAVEAIKTGVQAAKTAYDEIFLPIQGVVSDVFATIADIVATVWNGASGAVSKIGEGVEAAKDFFTGIYDTFKGFGSAITDGLMDGIGAIAEKVRGVINAAIGWVNTGLSRINSALEFTIPGVNIDTGIPGVPNISAGPWTIDPADLPSIPELSRGGIVPARSGGRVVRVGEGGYAEAIIPLDSSQGRGALGNDAFLTRLERMLTAQAERVEKAVERGSNAGTRRALTSAM